MRGPATDSPLHGAAEHYSSPGFSRDFPAVPHLLIIEARFYDDLADELLNGAVASLERVQATHDRVSVPGCLEIPAALAIVLGAMERGGPRYDGFVLLGCVIR